jgi:hypothetical protein
VISARDFPSLGENYAITSKPSRRYNCIAWAVGDDRHWWWPSGWWPQDVAREESIGAFGLAFASVGYSKCDDDSYEPGFDKIALFAFEGKPTHAARQLDSGDWSSKLGKSVDISHQLSGLAGPVYGQVVQIFKRQKAQ